MFHRKIEEPVWSVELQQITVADKTDKDVERDDRRNEEYGEGVGDGTFLSFFC
jgi:hypothetical protein